MKQVPLILRQGTSGEMSEMQGFHGGGGIRGNGESWCCQRSQKDLVLKANLVPISIVLRDTLLFFVAGALHVADKSYEAFACRD